ncbi:MAG TPA: hypothetical protein PKW44_05860, partial [Methylophilaceae bacterium]|nr:hypothetical protein [Methylophilaceae bacterium]
ATPLRAFAGPMQRTPASSPSLVAAFDQYLAPPALLYLRGPQEKLSAWKSRLDQMWLPGAIVIALSEAAPGLPQALQHPLRDEVNAWLCRGVECLPVVESWGALLDKLQVGGMNSTQQGRPV